MCEDARREPYKPRDLFGVQLEVTSLLLDAELKKLSTLQHELDSTQNLIVEDQEDQQLELICAISRIQAQVEQLEREYKAHALGALKSVPLRGSGKSNRSQPAMGLKHLPKLRPSIFGTVAKNSEDGDLSIDDNKMHPWDNANSFTSSDSSQNSSLLIIAEKKTVDCLTGHSHNSIKETSQKGDNEENSRLKKCCGKNCAEVEPLVYEDMNLVSGTLEALIHHLVPTENYYPDRSFIFAFILSSRLYIRPNELLNRVFKLAIARTKNGPRLVRQDAKLVSNIVQLLGEWADLFPYDFRDERMMGHVKTISQKCISIDPPIRKEVSQLLTCLLARLTALEKYEDFLHRITKEASLNDPLSSPSILSICPSPVTLAQQLTHIELERLSHIGAEEFVQAFAKDNITVEAKYKDMKKTHNLEFYVQWFNRLSYFVATEICKMPKKKSRVRVVEYWIDAARECFSIGNFNSLMAIIAGLNMSPVARLKKTWSKVSSTQQLSVLEHQMDPTANFTSYRSILRDEVWRFSSPHRNSDNHKIIIPFFSLLVKDLFFLNEGCASKIPSNDHINFEKFWQFAKQVTEVITWQQITCSFPTLKAILHSLQTAPVFSEKALCTASYECEAVDSIQEKQRLEYLQRDKSEKIDSVDNSPSISPKGSLVSNESLKLSL
ncbi:unnamed protein product [Allacma fusca]|uniref:Ras-GEF domain-containing family member 1B n=1 Tax=Allacma fusca TaxID=39272 RepID=A0A8J2KH56_9HEXA|nr:unnamed protein product [Allacma fusca]